MGCKKLSYYEREEGLEQSSFFSRYALEKRSTEQKKCRDYYPFGLQHATSWTRETSLKNNRLFNAGAELNENTGNYETFYRNYDPALGRFNGIDIKATKFASQTPYQFAGNNPIAFNDPMGDEYYYNIAADRVSWLNANGMATSIMEGCGGCGGGGGGGGGYQPYSGHEIGPNYEEWLLLKGLDGNTEDFEDGATSISSDGTVSHTSSEEKISAIAYSYHSQNGGSSLLGHSGVNNDGRTLQQYNGDGQYIQRGADGTMYVPYTNITMSAAELVNGTYTQANISLANSLSTNISSGSGWESAAQFSLAVGEGARQLKGLQFFGTSVQNAERALRNSKFLHNGNFYKNGYRGNQYNSASAIRNSKSAFAGSAKYVKGFGRGMMGVGVAISIYQFGASDMSGGDIARLVSAGIITGSAFIPVVGPVISIGLGVADSFGAFDSVYNSFD